MTAPAIPTNESAPDSEQDYDGASNARDELPTVWHVGGEDVDLRIPLLNELRDRGFQVGAVGSRSSDPFVREEIPYFRYPLDRGASPMADRRSFRRLKQLLEKFRPEIVHAFDTKPAIIATLAAKEANVPARVRSINGMGHLFSETSLATLLMRPFYRRLQRRASRAASVTIFQNADDRLYFRRHRMVAVGRDSQVPGSGVDLRRFHCPALDASAQRRLRSELGAVNRPIVTMVSRLVPEKGVREFLGAARRARASGADAVFLLVGPVEASRRRGALSAEEIQTSRDVLWLGRRNDVSQLLALSDLFVLPSYYREGIPRVLLEAGAAGLPLVTTNMPGCREVVRHGWNGLLVPPRNAAELTDAILYLLDSPHDRILMGSRSREHTRQNFSLRSVADQLAATYRRILMESRKP